MSVRLAKCDKEAIAKKMLRHRFHTDVKNLSGKYALFAGTVYDDVLAKDWDTLAAIPAGWIRKSHQIGVQFGNQVQYLQFNGSIDTYTGTYQNVADIYLPKEVVRSLPECYAGIAKVYEHHAFVGQWKEIYEDIRALKFKIAEAEKEIMKILKPLTTSGKVLQVWPEASPFLPADAKPVPMVVNVESINNLLELPVEEVA